MERKSNIGETRPTRGHFSSVTTSFSIVLRTTDGEPSADHEEIK